MTEISENVGAMALQLLPEQLLRLSLRDLETSAALCTAAPSAVSRPLAICLRYPRLARTIGSTLSLHSPCALR